MSGIRDTYVEVEVSGRTYGAHVITDLEGVELLAVYVCDWTITAERGTQVTNEVIRRFNEGDLC